ncbi:MAG: zinc-binding dehydrogenase [Bacillota bacterium]
MARNMGGDLVYNAKEAGIAGEMIKDSGGGVEVLLEMSGQPAAINDGFRVLRKGGWAALLGITPSKGF